MSRQPSVNVWHGRRRGWRPSSPRGCLDKVNEQNASVRQKIADLIRESAPTLMPANDPTNVPVSGKVFDAEEMCLAVDAVLDGWWTSGRFAAEFEKEFSKFMGVRAAILTNSGSSANLLAISALTSPSLGGKRLLPGDEVITVAAGFPTTVAPIVQNRLVPVFIDVKFPTYNVDETLLQAAFSERTGAIVLAHTLGNTFNVQVVSDFAKRHDLFLIEDACDAVGSTYLGRQVGTFGDIATVSFYPAHHITMGEGGAVLTDSPSLKRIVESFRDWGRDCWCDPGCDNTCGVRFQQQFGDLPYGYDHKYVYSHLGYNLKVTDMQAAIGLAQLKKLPGFISSRKSNFSALYSGLRDLEDRIILPEPEENADPSWFGFPITLRRDGFRDRRTLTEALNERGIGTRLLFGGNLTKQLAFRGVNFRVASSLENTDAVMERTFWVGVYPGIDERRMDYLIQNLRDALG